MYSLAWKSSSRMAVQAIRVLATSSARRCCFSMLSKASIAAVSLPWGLCNGCIARIQRHQPAQTCAANALAALMSAVTFSRSTVLVLLVSF